MTVLINHATTDRQQRALELHIEGLGYRKIAKRLFDEGYNHNGNQLSHMTIQKDMRKVVALWKDYMAETLQAHRAAHYIKAQYIWDEALGQGDLRLALDALKIMMTLLGTPMPQRHEVSHEIVPIGFLPVGVFDEI